jgi:hypothetical protein
MRIRELCERNVILFAVMNTLLFIAALGVTMTGIRIMCVGETRLGFFVWGVGIVLLILFAVLSFIIDPDGSPAGYN